MSHAAKDKMLRARQAQQANYEEAVETGAHICKDCRQPITGKHCGATPNVRVKSGSSENGCQLCRNLACKKVIMRWEYTPSLTSCFNPGSSVTNGFYHWKWATIAACEKCADAIDQHAGHATGFSFRNVVEKLQNMDSIMTNETYHCYHDAGYVYNDEKFVDEYDDEHGFWHS